MPKLINISNYSAYRMTRGEYNALRGWELPADEDGLDAGFLVVNHTVSERNVDGYDGYVNWLPAAVFHQQYKPVGNGMSFGEAIDALKSGFTVARSGWNGKGMYLVLVRGDCVTEPINYQYGKLDDQTPLTPVSDAIYMKTADNKFVPWVSSQTDVLSTDWQVVE